MGNHPTTHTCTHSRTCGLSKENEITEKIPNHNEGKGRSASTKTDFPRETQHTEEAKRLVMMGESFERNLKQHKWENDNLLMRAECYNRKIKEMEQNAQTVTQTQKVNEVMIQHLEGELNGRTLERETNEKIGQNLREQADKVATRTEMYHSKVNKLEEGKKTSTNQEKSLTKTGSMVRETTGDREKVRSAGKFLNFNVDGRAQHTINHGWIQGSCHCSL